MPSKGPRSQKWSCRFAAKIKFPRPYNLCRLYICSTLSDQLKVSNYSWTNASEVASAFSNICDKVDLATSEEKRFTTDALWLCTSSQHFSHFLRQVNGLVEGRCSKLLAPPSCPSFIPPPNLFHLERQAAGVVSALPLTAHIQQVGGMCGLWPTSLRGWGSKGTVRQVVVLGNLHQVRPLRIFYCCCCISAEVSFKMSIHVSTVCILGAM